GDGVQQRLDLPVHDDRVEPLLAAEVLVHDGLADRSGGSDLLDAGALESLLREELAADVEQLCAPLLARHAQSAARPAGRPSRGAALRAAARAPRRCSAPVALGLRRHPPIMSSTTR